LNEAARTLVVIVPGDLDTLTGGYGYDRRIISALRDRSWKVAVETLDGSFPQPSAEARQWAVSVLGDIPDDTTVLIDGLAFGVLPSEVEREQTRLRLVALVHHPLAAETGLDGGTASRLKDSERRALAAARRVIVTSRATASTLDEYHVPASRIAIVEPGTDRAPLAHGSRDESVRLLCVASVIPRKGHETLIRALATLRDRPWHLTCVGSVDRDRPTSDRVRALVREHDLSDRVTFTGDLRPPELGVEYDRADVFVLPTFYEGYGMVVAEALARGLPVVATATGGIRDLVADEAGILVPSGDVLALAGALADVVGDATLRSKLASGARRVRDRLPTWDDAATRMSAALESVSAHA
jgi:glycosyltransferase involved in cell wall biosynthesis